MFNLDVITKDTDIVKKLLIGSLLALTGVGIFALLGWMLAIMRRIQESDDFTLPDFDDIGGLFMDGLRATAVAVVWSLPLSLLVVIVVLVSFFAPSMFASADDAALVITLLTFCITGLVMIGILPLLMLLIPAMGHLAETGSVREALSPRRAFETFRANMGGFLIAALLGTLVNSVLGSLGAMLCLIGIYPAFVISYALQGQLFGSAYRDAKETLSG